MRPTTCPSIPNLGNEVEILDVAPASRLQVFGYAEREREAIRGMTPEKIARLTREKQTELWPDFVWWWKEDGSAESTNETTYEMEDATGINPKFSARFEEATEEDYRAFEGGTQGQHVEAMG